jgi:hypothetical protein
MARPIKFDDVRNRFLVVEHSGQPDDKQWTLHDDVLDEQVAIDKAKARRQLLNDNELNDHVVHVWQMTVGVLHEFL